MDAGQVSSCVTQNNNNPELMSLFKFIALIRPLLVYPPKHLERTREKIHNGMLTWSCVSG